MIKRNSTIATFVFMTVTAISGAASAGWFSDAIGTADFVAGGQKWTVLNTETNDGVESVTFLPAGQTAEQASQTLTLMTVVENVPSSAYDAQAEIDKSNNNDNTTYYKSFVAAQDQTVRAHGMYLKVPDRTYSQLFSLKGAYLGDGKTFLGTTYRVNIISGSKLAKQPGEAFDIMDNRIASIPIKQIKDWFKHFHDKAKKRLSAKQKSNTPKS